MATCGGRLDAPGWMQSGLEVEEGAPCSASEESARPEKARFLAAGFRVIQVLVGGRVAVRKLYGLPTSPPTRPGFVKQPHNPA